LPTCAHAAWKSTSAPLLFCTSGEETVENLITSRGQLAPCQEKRIKRQQTVSSARCRVLAQNAGFLLASMPSYCRFKPIECSYSQSISVSVPQDKIRGSAITPLFRRRSPFVVRAMEVELPTRFWLPLTKNSCAAIAFLFRVGIAFSVAEAISREPLIGPCNGSTTRFTANSSTWLKRVRHDCKIDCQLLLCRDGRCSGTSEGAVVHGNGPTATPL